MGSLKDWYCSFCPAAHSSFISGDVGIKNGYIKGAGFLVVIETWGPKCQSDTINLEINFGRLLTDNALRAFQTLLVNLFVSKTTFI